LEAAAADIYSWLSKVEAGSDASEEVGLPATRDLSMLSAQFFIIVKQS